jgi:hypothetical protein
MTRGVWAAVAAVVFGAWAQPARAQSAYVAGAIGAEVVRTSSSRSGGSTYDSGNGEALAGALRIGTFLTPRFGVELEFYRPAEIETDAGGPVYLAALDSRVTSTLFADLGFPPNLTFPSFMSQTTRARATTTSALVVARQPLGSRIELAYLGGIGFSRVVREMEFGFPRGVIPLGLSILPASYTTRTTQYGVGPVAGVEVRAGMTEHAQVVAGVRMHALGQNVVDGWMIRPNVGLAWKF